MGGLLPKVLIKNRTKEEERKKAREKDEELTRSDYLNSRAVCWLSLVGYRLGYGDPKKNDRERVAKRW